MRNKSTIRAFSLILGLAFSVSYIGLPIAIMACPMTGAEPAPMLCCETKTADDGVRLMSSVSYDCCVVSQGTAPLKFESPELKSTANTHTKLRLAYSIPFIPDSPLSISSHSSFVVSVGATFPPGVANYLFASSLRI